MSPSEEPHLEGCNDEHAQTGQLPKHKSSFIETCAHRYRLLAQLLHVLVPRINGGNPCEKQVQIESVHFTPKSFKNPPSSCTIRFCFHFLKKGKWHIWGPFCSLPPLGKAQSCLISSRCATTDMDIYLHMRKWMSSGRKCSSLGALHLCHWKKERGKKRDVQLKKRWITTSCLFCLSTVSAGFNSGHS